jgi:hypothetical protein
MVGTKTLKNFKKKGQYITEGSLKGYVPSAFSVIGICTSARPSSPFLLRWYWVDETEEKSQIHSIPLQYLDSVFPLTGGPSSVQTRRLSTVQVLPLDISLLPYSETFATCSCRDACHRTR